VNQKHENQISNNTYRERVKRNPGRFVQVRRRKLPKKSTFFKCGQECRKGKGFVLLNIRKGSTEKAWQRTVELTRGGGGTRGEMA